MYGRNKAVGGGMRGTSGSSRAGESGRKRPMVPNAGKPMQAKPRKPMKKKNSGIPPAMPSGAGLPLGMKHGGLYHQDEDVAMASKPRMGKAMGGQPSYGSGEMPKAMPN